MVRYLKKKPDDHKDDDSGKEGKEKSTILKALEKAKVEDLSSPPQKKEHSSTDEERIKDLPDEKDTPQKDKLDQHLLNAVKANEQADDEQVIEQVQDDLEDESGEIPEQLSELPEEALEEVDSAQIHEDVSDEHEPLVEEKVEDLSQEVLVEESLKEKGKSSVKLKIPSLKFKLPRLPFHLLKQYLKPISVGVVILFIAGISIFLLKPKLYSSKVELMGQTENLSLTRQALDLLKSPDFLRKVIATIEGINPRENTMDGHIKDYQKMIKTEFDESTNIITLYTATSDPQKADYIGKEILHNYMLVNNTDYRKNHYQRFINEVDAKINEVEREIREKAAYQLNLERTEYLHDLTPEKIEALSAMLFVQKSQMEKRYTTFQSKESKIEEHLRTQQGKNAYLNFYLTSGKNNNEVLKKKKDLTKMEFEKISLVYQQSLEHPLVIALDQRIVNLKAGLGALLRDLYSGSLTLDDESMLSLILQQEFLESKLIALEIILEESFTTDIVFDQGTYQKVKNQLDVLYKKQAALNAEKEQLQSSL